MTRVLLELTLGCSNDICGYVHDALKMVLHSVLMAIVGLSPSVKQKQKCSVQRKETLSV